MAPKILRKRVAVAALAGRKKAARVATPAARCEVVTEALHRATELPEDVRRLLCGSVVQSLGEPCDTRHAWQAEMVQWIGDAMSGIETSLVQKASEAVAKVEEVNAEKLARETALSSAEGSLVQLKEEATEAETQKVGAVAIRRGADKSFKEVAKAAAVGETETFQLAASDAELRAALAEDGSYAGWKEQKASRGAAADFAEFLQKHGFEPGLVEAVPLVVVKPLSERTDFSSLVLQQFEDAAEKRLSHLTQLQSDAGPAQTERVAAAAAAEEALTAATSALELADTALQDAQAAAKIGDVAAKEAKKAIKEFAPALREAQAAFSERDFARNFFQQGPLATFRELQARSSFPDPKKTEEHAVATEEETHAGTEPQESAQLEQPDPPAKEVPLNEVPANQPAAAGA